jgi:hypothetical protein
MKLQLDLHDAQPAPTELGCRAAWAGRRSRGATANLIELPRDFPERGGERPAKNPPHTVARQSRRRIPYAPPQGRSRSSCRDFPLGRSPPSPREDVGGTKTTAKKASAHAAALNFFRPFPRLFPCLVPGYLSGKRAGGRTLRPPIARPSSTLASSATFRADSGSDSLILGVRVDSG